MREKRTAAPDGNREAAPYENTGATILALAGRLGNCAACGCHIRLTRGATTCPTCSAWARWYRLHLAASAALKEAAR